MSTGAHDRRAGPTSRSVPRTTTRIRTAVGSGIVRWSPAPPGATLTNSLQSGSTSGTSSGGKPRPGTYKGRFATGEGGWFTEAELKTLKSAIDGDIPLESLPPELRARAAEFYRGVEIGENLTKEARLYNTERARFLEGKRPCFPGNRDCFRGELKARGLDPETMTDDQIARGLE